MTAQAQALISLIDAALAPAAGYVDLDPLFVDLPGQPGRAQAISIEGGAAAIIDTDTRADCYWVDLEDLPFCDLFVLAREARWCAAHDGLEVQR